MRRISTSKKALAALAASAVILGTTGVALAYWTSTGSGSSTASTGTTDATKVKVNQTTTVPAMYPGMSPVTLSGNFDNTNSGPVKVGSVTVSLGTLPSGCLAADFTIGGSAVVDEEIAVGTAKGSWSGLTLTMNNTSSNQDACKAQSIPLVYAVSAAS